MNKQLTKVQKIFNKIAYNLLILLINFIIPISTFAIPHLTYYIGTQLGTNKTNYDCQDFKVNNISVINGYVNDEGFSQNAIIGYKINKYLSIEANYLNLAVTEGLRLNYSDGTNNIGGEISESSYGISLKFIWPFVKEANIYTKLGIQQVDSEVKKNTGRSTINNQIIPSIINYHHILTPALSIGTTMHITNKFDMDISYSKINGKNRIEDIDFTSIGFYYFL